MSPETISIVALALSGISFVVSLAGLITYLAYKLSTHKVEFVTKEQQENIRESLGIPSEDVSPEEMDKLQQQFNQFYSKAGLGDVYWENSPEKDEPVDG